MLCHLIIYYETFLKKLFEKKERLEIVFDPAKDITAYELAQVLILSKKTYSKKEILEVWEDLPASVARHFRKNNE